MATKGIRAVDITMNTNIPKGAISYYLSGKSIPRADRLQTLAQYLNVNESWLLGYDALSDCADEPRASNNVHVDEQKLSKESEMIDKKKVASIADRLRTAMTIAGIKQADLSRKTGLLTSQISRYVLGSYEPKADAISKLAIALDVSDQWLRGYDVPMERPVMPYDNDEIADIVRRWKNDDIFQAVVKSVNELDYKRLSSLALMLDAFCQ